MLRIGKVLGTRSALTVSKWFLYVYSMFEKLDCFYWYSTAFWKVYWKPDLGENGRRDEILVFRNPKFWFCQSIITSDKGWFSLRTWDLNLVLLPQITIPTISFRFIWKRSDLCRNWFDVEFILLRRAYRIYYSLLGRQNISELNSSVGVYPSGFWKPGFIRMKRTQLLLIL